MEEFIYMNNYGIYFTDEIYQPIKCFGIKEGRYMVSTYGNIINERGEILSSSLRRGYPTVHLETANNGYKQFYPHRLVLETFTPNDDPINKTQVDHNDSCPTNNFIVNLEYVTQQENLRRETQNLKKKFAETGDSGNFKFTFTEEDVHVMCKAIKEGSNKIEALNLVGKEATLKNKDSLGKIINGKNWKDISFQYGFSTKKAIEFK